MRPLLAPAALCLVVLALGLLGAWRHELWRDEIRPWVIARDHARDLFTFLRYEGHPPLWYLLLIPLSRLCRDPFAMQVLHVLLGVGSLWIFLRHAPLPPRQKLLYAFGYFPFFEYLIVSRNYVLVPLLAYAFCALYRAPRRRYLLLGLVLFAMGQSILYGAILALVLSAYLVLDAHCSGVRDLRGPLFAMLCATLGAGGAFFLTLQPMDSWVYTPTSPSAPIDTWLLHIADLGQGYAPMQVPLYYWDAVGIDPPLVEVWVSAEWYAALSLLFLALSIWLLRSSRRVLGLYLVGTLGLWAFIYVCYRGTTIGWFHVRTAGLLFLVLLICLWLAPPTGRARRIAVELLLWIQLCAGTSTYIWDIIYPFSGSRDMVRYLRRKGLHRLPIAATDRRIVQVLSGFLDRPIYHTRRRLYETVYALDIRGGGTTSPKDMEEAAALARKERSRVVLVGYAWEVFPEVVWRQAGSAAPVLFTTPRLDPQESYAVYVIDPGVQHRAEGP